MNDPNQLDIEEEILKMEREHQSRVNGLRANYVVIDEVVTLSHGDQNALAELLRSEHQELD